MLPSVYPYDYQILKAAWAAFVEHGVENGAGNDVVDAGLDPAVLRSWSDCREAGVDPSVAPQSIRCSREELERKRHRCFDLIAVARPFMEDVYQFSGESDMIVYLADEELYVLDWLGDEALLQDLEDLGLDYGACLDERRVGTNAAAIAIRDGAPVQIVGPEHYCKPFHAFTGTAAPIHAPGGPMMGIFSIVTSEPNSHPHTLGIVMSAARAIEHLLQAELSLSEAHQHLTELQWALQAMSKGIIFLSPNGKVTHINDHASDILDLPGRLAMGRRLGTLIGLPMEVEVALGQRASMSEKELIFRGDNGARPCLVSIDVLKVGDHPLGFIITLEHASKVQQLAQRVAGTRAHFTFDDILGQDPEMRRVLYYARAIAQSDSTVLLLGESGTGKELFAQAIHNASRRADNAFVAINCAAIPRELVASELFGYEGAFAADEDGRPGKLELSNGGTIFFDNIDGMPLDMQASLLRVIDTREIFRLGGQRAIPLDIRIIAASNHVNLADEVKKGNFRDDLFYRLHVLTLMIPPLRERGNDILLLIAHLVDEFGHKLKKSVKVSSEAMGVLQSYHWPGNLRELESVLERAMYMVEGEELTAEHLPQELRLTTIGHIDEKILTLREAERQAIIRAGRVLQGNVTHMAQALDIGRTTLWRKMKRFKLSSDSFKR